MSGAEAKKLERGVLLVVDDEVEHGQSLRRIFERAGFRALTATGGQAALDVLRSEPVDVSIVDLMMPGMSGRDVLRASRTIRPETDVIVMTAYGTVENAVAAMREGAYD